MRRRLEERLRVTEPRGEHLKAGSGGEAKGPWARPLERRAEMSVVMDSGTSKADRRFEQDWRVEGPWNPTEAPWFMI